jgi:hypothetical protein
MIAIRSALAATIFTISLSSIALADPPFNPPGPPAGVPNGPPDFVQQSRGSVPIPGTDVMFGLGMLGLIIAVSLRARPYSHCE